MDTAAKFLDFITSTEQMTKGVGIWAAISVNKDVPAGTDNPLDAQWQPIMDSATEMYNNFDQALSLNGTTEYWRVQNAVLVGEMTPEQACPAMQSFIDSNA